MRRAELEHAIRAATQIVQDDQVIIIGSQSILGSYTEDQLPAAATMSPEVDIAPMRDDDADALSDQLSFDAGEWSEFHTTYGFYIEGVGKRTAILPPDWEYRGLRVCRSPDRGTPYRPDRPGATAGLHQPGIGRKRSGPRSPGVSAATIDSVGNCPPVLID